MEFINKEIWYGYKFLRKFPENPGNVVFPAEHHPAEKSRNSGRKIE